MHFKYNLTNKVRYKGTNKQIHTRNTDWTELEPRTYRRKVNSIITEQKRIFNRW